VVTRSALVIIVILLTTGGALADSSQAQLDAACEAAREKKLAPLRQNLVKECAAKGEKNEAECTRYYADWDGGRGAGKSKRFYDLPECEQAFDRQRDSTAR
jgi:hypothetical protein